MVERRSASRLVGPVALAVVLALSVATAAAASPGSPGSGWVLENAAKNHRHTSVFVGVSCADATACVAVGDTSSGRGVIPFVERRVGTEWARESVPVPAGSEWSSLIGVSCVAAACVTVGFTDDETGKAHTLAMHRTATGWAIVPTVDPHGKGGAGLRDVFCVDGSDCVAVGEYLTHGRRARTLIEAWDGVSWSIVPSPNPADSLRSYLASVTCTGRSNCVAVGSYLIGPTNHTLVERWDGSAWAIEPSADPPRAHGGYLLSVACTSPTACIATGGQGGDHNTRTMAEAWDGSAWTIQSTPNPKGAQFGGAMGSVSCAGAGACTAVGSYLDQSYRSAMFAVRWDGAVWSIEAPPPPDGSTKTGLNGVSCVTGQCVAVGFWENDAHPQHPLAERYTP